MSFRPSAAREDLDHGDTTRLPPLSSLFRRYDRREEQVNQQTTLPLHNQEISQKASLPQLLHPRVQTQVQQYSRQQSSDEASFSRLRPSGDSEGDEAASSPTFQSSNRFEQPHRFQGRRASLSAANPAYETSIRSDRPTFERLWGILLIARHHTDAYQQRYTSSEGPRPLPFIRHGDVATLATHLQYELNILGKQDSHTAERLHREAGFAQQSHWPSGSSSALDGISSGGRNVPRTFSPIQQWQSEVPQTSNQHEEAQQLPPPPSRANTFDSANARYRTYSLHSAPPPAPRRVRKRHDEADQSCLCCSATETPEWRKGPTGPRTLCNACGLLYAKQSKRRDAELQSQAKRASDVVSVDSLSKEAREKSLLELQLAVQSRQGQANSSNVTDLPSKSSNSGDASTTMTS